jgi:3-deoxy-manno-octulosonate cytidylyltransferase (CMP-KDO synthetase)
MKFIGIIPARYESSRFPGKPLCIIEGKTMIQRVYEQCLKTSVLSALAVATDDQRIFDHVKSFGGNVLMTDKNHSCGTDRCSEAFHLLLKENNFSPEDVVINIQGDEPLIDPKQIEIVCSLFKKKEVKIGTLVRKFDDESDLFCNTVQKVVLDKSNRVLYFSRTPIPYFRGADPKDWIKKHVYYMHIGIYAYVASVLDEIVKLPQSSLEKAEALEQLRWLENAYSVYAGHTDIPSHAVDVPSDVDKIIHFLKQK